MSTWVWIIYGNLARRLGAEHGRHFNRADVTACLQASGFTEENGNWRCERNPLEALRADEMVGVATIIADERPKLWRR